jgi:hypothetical protein
MKQSKLKRFQYLKKGYQKNYALPDITVVQVAWLYTDGISSPCSAAAGLE